MAAAATSASPPASMRPPHTATCDHAVQAVQKMYNSSTSGTSGTSGTRGLSPHTQQHVCVCVKAVTSDTSSTSGTSSMRGMGSTSSTQGVCLGSQIVKVQRAEHDSGRTAGPSTATGCPSLLNVPADGYLCVQTTYGTPPKPAPPGENCLAAQSASMYTANRKKTTHCYKNRKKTAPTSRASTSNACAS